jgi:hypothetical protein
MFGFLRKLFAPRKLAQEQPAPPAVAPAVAPAGDDVLINAYSSLHTLPPMAFAHRVQGRRDASDPALKEHLRGFAGWVRSLSNGDMSTARYHVLRHLQKVRHHVSLLVAPVDLPRFAAWAQSANAISFYPNGFICDPAGAILLSPDGSDDQECAAVPYPPSARERKARTEAMLAQRQLKPANSLPPVIAESEVTLRTGAEVAERIMALFAVAVRAESVTSNSPMASDEILQRLGLADDALSAAERTFIHDRNPTPTQTAQFGWCYECAWTLAWAVAVMDRLPFPGAICDVEMLAQQLLKLGAPGLAAAAALQPAPALLDALDLHQRLHWIVRQARVDGQAPVAGLEPGVIEERHRALNWLVRFEDASWDEVDTPT